MNKGNMSDYMKTSEICRICLSSNVKLYLSLFEKYKDFAINDYILLLTNVEIRKEDGFPDNICSACFIEFENAVNFKQKCESSDYYLKSIKSNTVDACKNVDLNDLLIVKKEEPYETEINFEEVNDSPLDDYYASEALEDTLQDYNNAPAHFREEVQACDSGTAQDEKTLKSRAIDLKLECHDCGNLFKSKCKLRVHWKRTHMLSSLICEICKRKFKSFKAYHLHKKKPTKSCKVAGHNLVRVEGEGRSRVFHCNECNYKTVRSKDIQMHIHTHNGDRPYECKSCGSRYTQLSSLQSHMEGAHKVYMKETTCHICGKQLKGRTKIYRHMKSHTAPKYPCPVCNKFFSKKNLSQHMVRHSGTKSYTCATCGSTFYTLSELCNHQRWVHNKFKYVYKCELCDYTANRSDRKKIHQRNHTDTNVPCITCGMFFPNVEKMEKHQIQHSAEKIHECPYCNKRFFNHNSVRKHKKVHHKSTYPLGPEQTNPAQKKSELTEENTTHLSVKVENDDLVVKIVKTPKKELT